MTALPQYVSRDVTHSGVTRYRFRMPGAPRIRLPGEPGSAEFEAAYQAAIAENKQRKAAGAGADRTKPGSIAELVAAYYQSNDYARFSKKTRRNKTAYLERLRQDHGARLANDLDQARLRELLRGKSFSVEANWLYVLRGLYRFGIDAGLVKADPTEDFKRQRRSHVAHRRWEAEDVALYREAYPLGTQARLAFEIMINTGLRVSDCARLGRAHVFKCRQAETGQRIEIKTEKKGVVVKLPVTRALAECIAATPVVGVQTFLVSRYGRPYPSDTLCLKMVKWTRDIGLPDCSSHGIRHTVGSTLAEAGAPLSEIMAVLGHTDPRMSMHYASQANKATLAQNAFARLGQ